MTTRLALARSFYAWLAKVQMQESRALVPFVSTDISSLKVISESVCRQLAQTPYGERAQYWQKLFGGYSADNLNENWLASSFEHFKRFMRAVFLPPPPQSSVLPADGVLMGLAASTLKKLKLSLKQIAAIRHEQWSYRYFVEMHHDNDLVAMSTALGYPIDDAEMTDALRRSFFYRWRLWAYALTFDHFRLGRLAGETTEQMLGSTIALFVWLMRKVFGDEATEQVVNNV